MLEAVLQAVLEAQEGGRGGVSSPGVHDFTSGNLPGLNSRIPAVRGVRGGRRPRAARKPRQRPHQARRLWFWHDLFQHINASLAAPYAWQNGDRKILANAARKYGVPSVMAMWDIYLQSPAYLVAGTILGMVLHSARLLDHPDFKPLARFHERRLEANGGVMSAAEVLRKVNYAVPKEPTA